MPDFLSLCLSLMNNACHVLVFSKIPEWRLQSACFMWAESQKRNNIQFIMT